MIGINLKLRFLPVTSEKGKHCTSWNSELNVIIEDHFFSELELFEQKIKYILNDKNKHMFIFEKILVGA